MEDKKQTKEDQKIAFNILEEGDEDLDLEETEILKKSVKKVSGTSTSKQQTKGQLHLLLKPHPGKMMQKHKGPTKLDEYSAVKKELRARSCIAFSRWMYDAGIPFNAVNYDSFDIAIDYRGYRTIWFRNEATNLS
ncbi:hypothetical protein AgCh_008443 [Apium graveolens]